MECDTIHRDMTIEHLAAAKGHLGILHLIQSKGLMRFKRDTRGYNEFQHAIFRGHIDVVEWFYEQGLETPGQRDGIGNCCLHLAVYHDSIDVLNFLLEKGLFTDTRNSKQQVPIHRSVYMNSINCFRELIKAGADLTASCHRSWRCIHYAAWQNNVTIMTELIEAGSDVNAIQSVKYIPP